MKDMYDVMLYPVHTQYQTNKIEKNIGKTLSILQCV